MVAVAGVAGLRVQRTGEGGTNSLNSEDRMDSHRSAGRSSHPARPATSHRGPPQLRRGGKMRDGAEGGWGGGCVGWGGRGSLSLRQQQQTKQRKATLRPVWSEMCEERRL